MSNETELSETDAIKLVIADGTAMDYIDVVDAVEKRFRIKTSSAVVEQVHHEMMKARTDAKEHLKPRMALEMASQIPVRKEQQIPTSSPKSTETPVTDPMALALQFVKSVGGMKHAKQALADLEAMLRE
ncbi:MAG: hypothetical protein KDB00_05290 [Planctomycetales bacterium]|nr:hypothetical protein [Planctomycetales bacterium]